MSADKFVEALKMHGRLSKADLFDRAGLKMSESNIALFELLVQNGKLLKEGVKRGTRYFLPEVANVTSTNLENRILEVLEKQESFVTTELEEKFKIPIHFIRESVKKLLDEQKIQAHGEKRGRFYTKPGFVVKTNSDDGTIAPISINGELKAKILDFFKLRKRNIVLGTLREQYPDESDHIIRGCLNELIAEGLINKVGEKRSTVYFLTGEKQEILMAQTAGEAIEFAPKLLEFIKMRRVLRPAVIANHFIKDKRLVHITINKLADEKQVKIVGEKRGKMVAVLDASEDEIEIAREEQQTIVEIVDKFTALISNGKSFAATQKVPEKITVKIRDGLTETSKTEFSSYSEFKHYLLNLLEQP